MKKFLTSIILILSAIIMFNNAVKAQDNGKPTVEAVQTGQKVENVFLYEKNGIISGRVTDEVFVINGDLLLKSTARVEDRVFVIDGNVTQEPGAQIGKGIYNIDSPLHIFRDLFLGAAVFFGIEFFRLIALTILLLVTVIITFIMSKKMNEYEVQFEASYIKAVILGLIGLILLGSIAALFALTIWGIPFSILIGLIGTGITVIGFSIGSYILGKRIVSGHNLIYSPTKLSLLSTTLILALINLPIIGTIWGMIFLCYSLGLGLLLLTNKSK